MTHKKLNRIIAIGVFLVTSVVYIMTLSCTVVFWDVGEFIAASKLMQVPHPPGSPLFLYWVRIAMMIPFVADQAVRAHAFSAICSALGIMFTYLVIVRVVIDFKGIPGFPASVLANFGLTPINMTLSDIRPMVRAELKVIDAKLPKGGDAITTAHYIDLHARIKETLNPTRPIVNIPAAGRGITEDVPVNELEQY